MPFNGSAESQEENELQTAPVRQGDITISATGAGTVIPAKEIVIGFNSGGVLEALLVSVGDEVSAGDVLAQLDDTSALQQVANAEAVVPVVVAMLSSTGDCVSALLQPVTRIKMTITAVQALCWISMIFFLFQY